MVSVEEFVDAFKKVTAACEEDDVLPFLEEKIKIISKGVIATEGCEAP